MMRVAIAPMKTTWFLTLGFDPMASRSEPDAVGEALDGLLSGIGRTLSRYSLEILLAGLLGLVYWAAQPYGGLTVASVGIIAAALPWTRRYFGRLLRGQHVKRRFAASLEKVNRGRAHPIHARISHVKPVAAGDSVRVHVANGTSIEDVIARDKSIASAMSSRTSPVSRIRIVPDYDGRADQATALLVRRNPFIAPPLEWPWKDKDEVSLWDPVPLGIDEFGEPVHIDIVGKNFLIGGEPESGKSASQMILTATAVKGPNCHLWIMDGKQLDTALWAPCARRLVGPNGADAIHMLKELHVEMEARRQELLAHPDAPEKIERSMGLPLHFLLIDELAAYLRLEESKEVNEILRLLLDLVSRGRAVGFIVCAATQKPGSELHPQFTALRDLFSYRLAFRCGSYQMSEMILGGGTKKAGYDASDIPAKQRGVGYLHTDGYLPEKIRGYFLTREDRRQIAASGASVAIPDDASAITPPTPPTTPKRVSAEEARARDNRASLLATLPELGDGLTRSEIQLQVGRPDRELWPVLKALLEDGTVVKSGGGKKGDPFRYRRAPQTPAGNGAEDSSQGNDLAV
jgi:S-DNA-T family DNA segregation ATPase FtsK/SpoIIIE